MDRYLKHQRGRTGVRVGWRAPAPAISLRLAITAPLLIACAGTTAPPPTPGQARGSIPDLSGSAVLVYPFQRTVGVLGDVDAELRFALDSGGSAAEWVGPDAMRASMVAAPGVRTQVDGLPVDAFLAGEVLRIGDPLFGLVRRMAVLHDARFAVLPVSARYRAATPELEGAIELAAALVEVSTGRILWYGVGEGMGEGDDPAALAMAAQGLARWFR